MIKVCKDMIRLAEHKDIPLMLAMGQRFFDASGYESETEFNAEDTEQLFIKLMGAHSLLTDGEGGMIGFVVFPMFMNTSHVIAQELFWWVDEEKRSSKLGLNLLKAAEATAKELGAKSLLMLSLNDLNGEKVNKLYESLGYTKREQTYMRSL